jgi:hypothetical protein
MRSVLLAALAGAGVVLAATLALDDRGEVFAQLPQHPALSEGPMLALPGPADETGQLVTVIDPRLRVIGVYHIEQSTGKIGLRSVRNVHWDLQMTHLNCETPLPREIQSLLEPR